MNQPLSNSQTRDVEALLHPYTNAVALRETGAMIIERGEGIRVFDDAGRPYIEALGGLWCCGLGFGNAELVEAARAQMEKLPYYHLFGGKSHEPAVELAERIKELAPGQMARVFYQSSGSEANDTQVKFAWYYNNALGRPEKKKIISRVKAYHGVTIVAASMTGLPNNHRDFDLPVDRHPAHRDAALLEGRRARRERGGLRGAPRGRVRGAGARAKAPTPSPPSSPSRSWARAASSSRPRAISRRSAAVCRAHDILMISDEVICGFGRTGEWFGAQALNYRGHLDVHGQAADRRLPAAVGGGDQRRDGRGDRGQLRQDRHASATATPTAATRSACAVGVKALEIYRRIDITARVRGLAPRFAAHFDRLAEHPLVGEVRHLGLMGGIELAPERLAARASPRRARSARGWRRS